MLTKNQFRKITRIAAGLYKKNDDPFHDLGHAEAVSGLAEYIAKREGADAEICRVAGLLHDVAPKKRGVTHGRQSGRIIGKALEQIGLNKDFIDQVILAVINHDSKNRHLIESREGEIIFEADKLECFGPVGLIREYGDLLLKGYGYKAAFKQLLEYLAHYNPSFKTKTANQIKKELKEFNKHFILLYYKYRKT